MAPRQPTVNFRANIGAAILLPKTDRILVCERRKQPGSYQLPQGGPEYWEIVQGVLFKDIALREVREELGIAEEDLYFLDEYPEWVTLECPIERRSPLIGLEQIGQNQKFFFFLFGGKVEDIDLSTVIDQEREFISVKPMTFAELINCCDYTRVAIYTKLAQYALEKKLFYRELPSSETTPCH